MQIKISKIACVHDWFQWFQPPLHSTTYIAPECNLQTRERLYLTVLNPGLHVQTYEPLVSLHVAFGWQGRLSTHSLTSEVSKVIYQLPFLNLKDYVGTHLPP